jgi:hypothetical protein
LFFSPRFAGNASGILIKSYLVSYASEKFLASQERLAKSALRNGIDEIVAWNRSAMERTTFYKMHKDILDQTRGAGYWLWKSFIIEELLTKIAPGDVLVYLDAGVEVVADLFPLFKLCLQRGGLLIFAGHYDDVRTPGPNICSKWTKRDCFVGMNCDKPRYHDGRMLDASLIVSANMDRSRGFIHEWGFYCRQPQLLTDQPNLCGLPDLPGFINHRHDQSILSLLAIRDGIEVFRHPSQFGNHMEEERFRVPGEWKRYPYGIKGVFSNSPYATLLNHHRGGPRSVVVDRKIGSPVR